MTSQAIGATVSTSIHSTVVNNKLAACIPGYLSKAAATADLGVDSITPFVTALTTGQPEEAVKIAGVHQLNQPWCEEGYGISCRCAN